MIKIKNFAEEHAKKYIVIVECIYTLYNSYDGAYYILDIDGKEKVLHRINNIFTILSLDEDYGIEYSVFTINDNYEIIDAGFDDFETHIVDGILTVQNRDTLFTQCLYSMKRDNGLDYDGFDGVTIYSQYDPNSDVRAIITYQQMYCENRKRIYPNHIEIPFIYSLEKNATRRFSHKYTYIRMEYRYDKNPNEFNMATIKDYGLRDFLKNGPVKLQQSDKIIRYYKVLAYTSQKVAITGFPFATQYEMTDMNELFTLNGFHYQVPSYLLDLYNGDYQEMNLFKEIANILKEIEMGEGLNESMKGKPFHLK